MGLDIGYIAGVKRLAEQSCGCKQQNCGCIVDRELLVSQNGGTPKLMVNEGKSHQSGWLRVPLFLDPPQLSRQTMTNMEAANCRAWKRNFWPLLSPKSGTLQKPPAPCRVVECFSRFGVSINVGTPKWIVYNGTHYRLKIIKMDDLVRFSAIHGLQPCMETPISTRCHPVNIPKQAPDR